MIMKNLLILIFIMSIVGFSSCKKVIDFNADYVDQRLVVNSFIKTDSLITIKLSKSRIILDNAPVEGVQNATVKLYENGEFLETMTEKDDGLYVSENRAVFGNKYSLTASASGYDDVSCQTEVPYRNEIISIDTSSSFDEYGNKTLDFQIEITQNVLQDDYYCFRLKYIAQKSEEEDGYYYYNGDYYVYPSTNDVIVEETDWDGGLLFSDRLMTNDKYTLTGSVQSYYYDTIWLRFELYSYSKEMYDYQISKTKHLDAQGNPMMEPIIVYSNVSSGMGIFGAGAVFLDSIQVFGEQNVYYK